MIKKTLILALPFLFLIACTMGNTPTAKVEELFTKYQQLDKDIQNEIVTILNEENLSESQKERYKKILEKQYRNLTYQIKEEIIDDDSATIDVDIEVIDLKKAIDNLTFDTSIYTTETYNEEKLKRLENAKEKVQYRLRLTLTKDKNGNWNLNTLRNETIKKIQGMY